MCDFKASKKCQNNRRHRAKRTSESFGSMTSHKKRLWHETPNMAPSWPQDGAKLAPGRLHDGPKRPQKLGSHSCFFDLGRQGPPRALRGLSKIDFWSIFGRFLVDFWLIFGRFLIHFSVDFLLIDFFSSSLFYFQLF